MLREFAFPVDRHSEISVTCAIWTSDGIRFGGRAPRLCFLLC